MNFSTEVMNMDLKFVIFRHKYIYLGAKFD